ncbi:hypothetical protein [Roseibium aquae]|nr:hypothetical protein [Roseibium aquae]
MSTALRLATIQDRFEGYMPMTQYGHLIPPAQRVNNPEPVQTDIEDFT